MLGRPCDVEIQPWPERPARRTAADEQAATPEPGPDSLLSDTQTPGDRLATVTWRHSGWQPTRSRVARAELLVFGNGARLQSFEACGSAAWVWKSQSDPIRYRITSNCCHDRWCVPCARHRGRVIAACLNAHVQDKRVRFLTLTQSHRDETARASVDRLLASWQRLRRRADFKAHVQGGICVLELKRSRDQVHWHTHLHVIFEGRYWPHLDVRTLWYAVTGDSSIVDIRPCKSSGQLATYVCKYLTKPVDGHVLADPELLEQAMRALHGRRTVTTFGTWRGLDLDAESDEADWVLLGPLAAFIRQANAGDPEARLILETLARQEGQQCQTTKPP
jgi:hypothetical protein